MDYGAKYLGTADTGYIRLYGCETKSVSAGLGYGLG